MSSEIKSGCPVCFKLYPVEQIENHVDKCLFLNSQESVQNTGKRFSGAVVESPSKKLRHHEDSGASGSKTPPKHSGIHGDSRVPLAETMRPASFADFIGQEHVLGEGKTLRQLISNHRVPSMILWGPPGCGKTTLAHIIHKMSRELRDTRFVKLSCTAAGVNDVKEIVQCAKNELNSFKRSTLLFMDEIHRFNKLQQDVFLPHIESGLITLIGATTENPSFSLNNSLLSRCRVIVLEKLSSENVVNILKRAVIHLKGLILSDNDSEGELDAESVVQVQFSIESDAIHWLADMCDGDARIALNSLQMALESASESKSSHLILKLSHIEDGLKKSHLLYDKKGEEHYNLISALHKSIRASDDNAALYWLVRMLEGGEDPVYIARRLVRAAAEDVGLMDPLAMTLAVSAMQGCQMIGMPECDVLLAQVVTYLARTHKSREVNDALSEARRFIKSQRGPLPGVPLHLRNASSKLNRELGYGKGYNMREKDSSNLTYMPPGMESVSFFKALNNDSNQND